MPLKSIQVVSGAFGAVEAWLETHLQGVMWILIVALVAALISGSVIAYANRGSQNVVLGLTGLFGAMMLFLGQLFFQLRVPAPSEETIVTQIMVESKVPRVVPYPDVDMLPRAEPVGDVARFIEERDAGAWLSRTNPTAFRSPERLVSDLLVFSFVNFLLHLQQDWRMTQAVYTFPNFPGIRTLSQFTDPKDSSQIDVDTLRAVLKRANNLFADAQMSVLGGLGLRMPPGCKLHIVRNELALTNELAIETPTMNITFTVQPAERLNGIPAKAAGGGLEITASDGTHDLHLVRMTLRSTISALHAQDPELETYRAWFARLARGARDWFKPAGSGLS